MPECENRIMENDSRVEKGRIEEGSQTGLYEMEELLPLLAALTRKFTSGESGSVSYERARHLMEGILYTLRIYEKEGSLVGGRKPDASEAWRIGQELLARMVQETQEKYRLVCEHFQAYGNRNLQDTFVMALPGFFRLYDRKFVPQDDYHYGLSGAFEDIRSDGNSGNRSVSGCDCSRTELFAAVFGGICERHIDAFSERLPVTVF